MMMRLSGAMAVMLLLSAVAIVAAGGSKDSNHNSNHNSNSTSTASGCSSSSYMNSNGSCSPCPEFAWSAAGSVSASDCTCWYGYTAQTDGSCAPISNSGGDSSSNNGGGSSSSSSSNTTCDPSACVKECGEGYYSSTGTWDCTNKRSTCKKCPRYSWSAKGSDSKSDCVCWSGYEGAAGGPCKAVSSSTSPAPPSTSVDGGWCPASECSATCGGGTQSRECACPAPSGGGANCSGEATVTCASCSCADAPQGGKLCPESTYSATGMWVSNSAAECTACPAFSWSAAGSRSVSECGCWDRYTGAAGGPCTFITGDINGGWCPWLACDSRCGSGVRTRVCGCPYQSGNGSACEGESSGACEGLPECGGSQPAATPCSAATSEDECWSWQGCAAVSGYACGSAEWSSYLGCATQAESNSCTKQGTCAVSSSSGDRAWLPSSLLPAGYVATTEMGSVRSCCKPQTCNSSSSLPGSGHGQHGGGGGGSSGGGSSNNNNETSGDFNVTIPGISTGGCTWQLGGACVVLQFRGDCPVHLMSVIAWAETLVSDLESQLSQLNASEIASVESRVESQVLTLLAGVDLSAVASLLRRYVTIVSLPTANNGTGAGTYSVVLQLLAQASAAGLPFTPEQVIAAIQAVLASGWLANTDIASQLQGVAAYASMSNTVTATPTTHAAASGAEGLMHASLMVVLATGIVGTVVAKVASFMQ